MRNFILFAMLLCGGTLFSQDLSTEVVYNHHSEALLNRDIAELIKDYDENSILITPDGKMHKGIEEINRTFEYALAEFFPKNIRLNIINKVIEEELVFLTYSIADGETGKVLMPFSVDTFVIENGKIKYQTVATPMPEN